MKQFMMKYLLLAVCFSPLVSFAGPGLFFKASNLSTSLIISTTIPNHTYPTAGIKINSPGYSLTKAGTECIQNTNGYCIFSVNDKTPTVLSIAGSAGTLSFNLCLNGIGPLTCQQYTGLANQPVYAYLVDVRNNTIQKCLVKADGGFNTCSNAGNTGIPLATPLGIVTNNATTFAYVSNKDTNQILKCPVKPNGDLGVCTDSGNTGVPFISPINLTLNSAETIAYIADQDINKVSVCPINVNGSFGVCTYASNTGLAFDAPVGVALNPAGNFAYVTNQGTSNRVLKCAISASGDLVNCTDTNNLGFTFTHPDNLAINSSNTFAYVTNSNYGASLMYICPVLANGDFGFCTVSANSFIFSASVTLNKLENIGYIANGEFPNVKQCPIKANGSFGVCTDAGGGTFGFIVYMTLTKPTTFS
jgi:hypothetical protein